MEDLKKFAKLPGIQKKYPGFYRSVCNFDKLVGLDEMKTSIANRVKYIICSNSKLFNTTETKHTIQTRNSKKKRNAKKKRSKPAKKRCIRHVEVSEDEDDEQTIYIPSKLIELVIHGETPKGGDKNGKRSIKNLNMNTLITGDAGTGKTTTAIMLAKLYKSLNLVNGYKIITRGDIVGKYQGFTTANIKTLIDENRGGILILDEAYGISTGENDSFGDEAIVEIIESMTNEKKNISWFFIGYEKQIKKNLVSNNDGFKRRIGMTLNLKPPTVQQVYNIFKNSVAKTKWKISKSESDRIWKEFEKNKDTMKAYGGDVERLVSLAIEDSINIMWPNITQTKEITACNVRNAFKQLSEGSIKGTYSTMYI